MTIAKQIGVYALSILLPPLGLWPAVHYVLQKDEKTRIVGFIAIILTAISLGVTIWIFIGLIGNVNQNINSQLNLLQ